MKFLRRVLVFCSLLAFAVIAGGAACLLLLAMEWVGIVKPVEKNPPPAAAVVREGWILDGGDYIAVIQPVNGDEKANIWDGVRLVFKDRAAEGEFRKAHQTGEKVKVAGQLGFSGGEEMIFVASVEKTNTED